MAKRRNKPKPVTLPGYDGTHVYPADVRISMTRTSTKEMRCRPGTFEWRYGRKTQDGTLYNAGCDFAKLWERAGTAAAASPDLMREGQGSWKGLPDGRVAALDRLRPILDKMDDARRKRLVAYCVDGRPVSEVAVMEGERSRDTASVLHSDLKALAIQLNYR